MAYSASLDGPVVAIALVQVLEERVDAARELVEERPLEVYEAIRDLLGRDGIVDGEEGVLESAVADPSSIELAREPLVPIDVDLDREGKPGLDPDVEEAEHRIDEVVVEEEALAPGGQDAWPSLAERKPEAATGLDGGDHSRPTPRGLRPVGRSPRPACP